MGFFHRPADDTLDARAAGYLHTHDRDRLYVLFYEDLGQFVDVFVYRRIQLRAEDDQYLILQESRVEVRIGEGGTVGRYEKVSVL